MPSLAPGGPAAGRDLRPDAALPVPPPPAWLDEGLAEATARIVQLEETELTLRRLDNLRRTFISEAAHELNTPLTPMSIHLEALADMPDLAQAHRQHLAVIQRNLRHLVNLVQGMLAASRLETGRFELARSDFAFGDLVTEVFADASEPAATGGIRLQRQPMEGVRVHADLQRIRQVVQNLVANAIRMTPPGGQVVVAARQEGRQVLVRVTDSGVGLSPEQIGQLFQPFSRPHKQLPGAAKGTGLGLYLAKGIIEQHGGRIWAESDGPGQGASFCFFLPAAMGP